MSIPCVVEPKPWKSELIKLWIFIPNEVLIEEPKILGSTKALAILSESSFPVKKFAKYLNKKGFTLYSDNLLALLQAPSMWL